MSRRKILTHFDLLACIVTLMTSKGLTKNASTVPAMNPAREYV